jgi:hypothetical protein
MQTVSANILIQRFYILTIYFSLLLLSCGQSTIKPDTTKKKMKLTYDVIPEDYDRHLYYVEWYDTLGKSEGYLPKKILRRPKEVWCTITNKNNDTLGYYHGLSMAQTFAYFQTTDTVVTFNFRTGLNMFSDKLDDDKEGRKYWEANRIPIEFKPVNFNIKADLKRKFEIELKEK